MDRELVIAQFVERCYEHADKRVDNASLIAGSPMHYYCRHCSAPTETLPEEHRERPNTFCAPCLLLEEQGLLAEAKEALARGAVPRFLSSLERQNERDRDRFQLKMDMLAALGPDTCTQTLCTSIEEVFGLIKSGEADLLLVIATGRLTSVDTGEGTPKRIAVRFNDRGLGERAREDCLDLYGLRDA